MFVCGVIAAAGNYPRPGFAAAWAGDFAVGRHIHADAERRLPVADERSRADGAGNPAAFASRRRGVRGIFEDDDADVPICEADPEHDSAGPDDAEAKGFDAAEFSDTAFPVAFERRAVHAGSADDDVSGGLSGSVVRDRRAEGDDVGFGDY